MKRFIALAAALAMVFLVACGSDDNETPAAGGSSPTESSEAAGGVLTVNATEFAFSAPASTPAGETTFDLVNKGEQAHMVILVELLEGKTIDDVNSYLKESGPNSKPPSWVKEVKVNGAESGKTLVAPPDKEATSEPVDLEAGEYAMLCFIPDGKGGKPHALLGMTAALSVE